MVISLGLWTEHVLQRLESRNGVLPMCVLLNYSVFKPQVTSCSFLLKSKHHTVCKPEEAGHQVGLISLRRGYKASGVRNPRKAGSLATQKELFGMSKTTKPHGFSVVCFKPV